MKYFAEFDTDGNKTAGYVADGMPYTEEDIQKKFPDAIEISEEDQILYITGEYIRDNKTGKPIKKQPIIPTLEEIKKQKLQELDNEYQPKFLEIARSWSNANMDGNTELMKQKQLEKQNLIKEYNDKREVILNG